MPISLIRAVKDMLVVPPPLPIGQPELRDQFDSNGSPKPCFEGDEHFEAEFVPLAAHEVGHSRLRNAKALGRFGLSQLLLLDTETKIAHQVGTHVEHSRLSRIEPKIDKHIAAGFRRFLFHD